MGRCFFARPGLCRAWLCGENMFKNRVSTWFMPCGPVVFDRSRAGNRFPGP
ncbi:hypothetical protein ASZ90_003001 [hydrocarbon metagenome]|uniref:Uncharacterized protein n=1 Tax=hydrocarbon metagenome TaxID=938273 RepID=A0A0W8G2B1_9ZZZZ